MAGPDRVVGRKWSQTGDDAFRALVEEFNKLVDDVEEIRANATGAPPIEDLTASKIVTREAGDP